MREAGLVAAEILDAVCDAAKPGASTWDLDQIARRGMPWTTTSLIDVHSTAG